MLLDPRSVANLILEEASERKRHVTNLGLQKILYFIQGRYLIETDEPLMMGYFEAWQYGPVHPLIYDSFKHMGSEPLREPARQRNLMTGHWVPVDKPAEESLSQTIRDIAWPYLGMSPGRLVDLSHAKGSPWDVLTKSDDGSRSFGLRITHDIIRERFKHHKVSVDKHPIVGEPNEESPPY